MPFTQPVHWAQSLFGHANLNDPRCTGRVVVLATVLAHQPGQQSRPAGSHRAFAPHERTVVGLAAPWPT
ncbi:transposase DNA-binding-containing protein [Aeromonas sp. 164P]